MRRAALGVVGLITLFVLGVTMGVSSPGVSAASTTLSFSSGFNPAWLNTDPAMLPWNSMTTLIDFSLITSPARDGSTDMTAHGLTPTMMLANTAAAHQHGKKALISIGGSDDRNWDAACNSANRAKLAANLVNVVKTYGYDGIDIDIEQDFGGPAYVDYSACMVVVRAALKAYSASALLTTDGDPDWQANMVSHAAQSFDLIQIMSYWSAVGPTLTGEMANYTSLGMPASKLVVGLGTDPWDDPTVVDTTAAACLAKVQFALATGLAGIMNWYPTNTSTPCTNVIAPFVAGTPPPPAPTVSSVAPNSGPAAGGTSVTIIGTNLTGAAGVKFGATTATFSVTDATHIAATSPVGSGIVDVRVTTAGGTSATSSADQFTYVGPPPPAPTVTGVSPASGPAAGGTPVTITGTNFSGATAVTFGAATATYTVNSATQISATSPAGAGMVDVTVTTAGGTSATGAADQFTYISPPTVTAVAPNSGPAAGGTAVTITGTNFTGATALKFGGATSSYTVTDATHIAATTPAGSGIVNVRVTTAGGTSAVSSADQFTFVAPVAPGSVYTAVTPVRLLDTRNGGTLGTGGSMNLTIGGATFGSLTVPANASAVILNVTATNESAAGFFTVYPAGGGLPTASNLNFALRETVPNLVSVGLGVGGAITIYNGVGSSDAVVDLEGYYAPPGAGTAGELVGVVPARITDTRAGSGQANAGMTLGAGATLDVQVTGMGGIPAGVSAVVMNVTATNTSAAGFFTVYPTGVTRPLASNLNFTARATVPNRVIVPVGSGGKVSFYNGVGSADLIVDVGAYFTNASSSGASFRSLTPTRIVDTRTGTGGFYAPLGQGSMVVTVAGNGGVPGIGAATPPTAVVLNVTVTGATAASDLAVWPDGSGRPVASDLNFMAGQTVPNLVIVKLSSLGKIDIGNDFGSTHVIVDVVGWYG